MRTHALLLLLICLLVPFSSSAAECAMHETATVAVNPAQDGHSDWETVRMVQLVEAARKRQVISPVTFATPAVKPTGVSRTFTITAQRFEFVVTPEDFSVNQGDDVTLNITSSDVTHGFALDGYVNDIVLNPNSTKTVHFVASKVGPAVYFCTQSTCGVGHSDMFGTFTVKTPNAAGPIITNFAPASGPTAGGTSVSITGTGFQAGATVTFGGLPAASTVVNNASSITALTPPQGAGSVPITVTNPDGGTSSLSGFTYVAAPAVSGIAPASGPQAGGTAVTITGMRFLNGAAVSIGGVAATSVNVVNSTTITATTPAHALGDQTTLVVNVVVTNPDGQSATLTNGFTFLAPAGIGLTAISPVSGLSDGGTTVTLTGSGFSGGTPVVTIGSGVATNVTVTSDTTLTAKTVGHYPGPVDVVVSRNASQARLAGAYLYSDARSDPVPHGKRRRGGKH